MKIKPEHFYALRNAIFDAVGDRLESARAEYQARGLPAQRFRWDMLWAVPSRVREPLMRELYAYLNDEHIDTALRALLDGPPPARALAQPVRRRRGLGQARDRRILVTYEIITPESAEEGDAAERGWVDDEGSSMEPDEYDLEEGITAVDNAVKFLCHDGATEASSYPFSVGTWYTTEGDPDYRTGETEYHSYHLKDFTPEEERVIYDGVVTRECGRRRR